MQQGISKIACPKCTFPNPITHTHCGRCKASLPKISLGLNDFAAPVDPSAAAVQFRKGQIIANRYTVMDLIGRGGMGSIYLVQDNTLNEPVALKTLLPQFVKDKLVVERFYNEARIARQLSHPNIVRVHDIGMAGSILYISMEYLRGRSLRQLIDEQLPGERLPIQTVLRIIDELCAALEYAHQYTVHRDIKPENVMLGEDGRVRLMDFGISKLMSNPGMTATSVVMGTPQYMSPEQLRDSGAVDGRSDIFSIGVVLYEMLTGNLPTGIPKPASQARQGVPPTLDPIVAKCVDPDPRKRYQTVQELREAIRPIRELMETGTHAVQTRIGQQRAGVYSRLKRPLGVVLCLLVALGAAAGLWKAEQRRQAMAGALVTQGPKEPAPPTDNETPFARLEALFQEAKLKAKTSAADHADLAEMANAWWEEAAASHSRGDEAGAMAKGMDALQVYVGLALLAKYPSMAVIPPGNVTLRDGGVEMVVALPGFLIGKYEVTNGEYSGFVAEAKWREPLYSGYPDAPVTGVTFYDAQAYAAFRGFSLPTEAQWARAAYGYTDSAARALYPWGDKPREELTSGANWNTPSGPAKVGAFADDYTYSGCADMAGNVSEWTRTLYMSLPYRDGDNRNDPGAPTFGTTLTLMGGSWGISEWILTRRAELGFNTRSEFVGFRCVKELPTAIEEAQAALAGL